jgi:hypothetical protein
MTDPWRRRDVRASGPTLVNVLPPVSLSSSAPDPQPPPAADDTLPPAPFHAFPPPPNRVQGRSTALALGLVAALMVATAVGSLGIARAIATGFPTHFASNGPASFPAASPPEQWVPGGEVPSVATLLTALNATPTTPGVTIDPALAQRIVDTLWPVREIALASDDLNQLAPFETGSALQGDAAEMAANACGCTPPPRPLAVRDLFVPKQSTYPAWFVGEVTTGPTTGSPADVAFMVFTRASLSAHWMLALETEYAFSGGGAWVYATPESMAGGFDLPSSPHNELPADLGAYYEHWADTGMAPPTSPFAPGTYTTTIGETQVKEDERFAALGEIHRVTYSVDVAQDGDWTVAANNVRTEPSYGWALSCGTVRYEAVTTLAPGAPAILQPVDRSTWGATLAPGQYTSVTQWGLHETCFLDDLTGIPYLVFGHDGGVIRSSGVSVGISS